MVEKITDVKPPTGMARFLFRLPIYLYRLGLGWLLGGRFLLLNHVGRKSGVTRRATLEVVKHERQSGTYYVAAAFGKQSDWYQNILKTPAVSIQVGRRRLDVVAEPLAPDEGGEVMVDYARRHPTAARALARFMGYRVDGTEEDYRTLGREYIPMVALRPRD